MSLQNQLTAVFQRIRDEFNTHGPFNLTSPVDGDQLTYLSGEWVNVSPSAPPDPTNPPYYKCAGSVLSDGTLEEGAGASVVRISQGIYEITFTGSPANSTTYPVLATMQALAQNDDYQWAYLARTTTEFRIEVREQDNGGTAGVLRDSGFSFYVPII